MIKRLLRTTPLGFRLSVYFVFSLIIVALCAPYLANDVPYYIRYNNHKYYPLFSGQKVLVLDNGTKVSCDYKNLAAVEGLYALYPPVPFSPLKTHIGSADYKMPGSQNGERTHWLGTNQLGEDTLARMIHGTRVSIQVGLISMLIALVLGLVLGSLAGYFGNQGITMQRLHFLLLLMSIIPAYFYAFVIRKYVIKRAFEQSNELALVQVFISLLVFVLIILLFWWLGKLLLSIKKIKGGKLMHLPLDNMIGRLVEFVDGLPVLVLLIVVSVIIKPGIYLLILLIGFTAWISIARYTRAEVLKIRRSDYMHACKLMGMSHWRIIFNHLLPNAMGPALVAFTFGVASAILAESSLSFLGIGIPDDVVTWGKVLADGRDHFKAWWLVWSPGLAIFLLLLAVNTIGQYLRKNTHSAETLR
ncbi:ABC transporter permease subunit [bacterium]|nr:ABC transporter permease subunit [bacterium]